MASETFVWATNRQQFWQTEQVGLRISVNLTEINYSFGQNTVINIFVFISTFFCFQCLIELKQVIKEPSDALIIKS